MYANVAFPLRISPLTYKVPSGAPADLEGRVVRAPLMGRTIYGLVMSTCKQPETGIRKEIREIHAIYQKIMSGQAISFLRWLSDYYLAPVGTALRSSFFDEITSIVAKNVPVSSRASLVEAVPGTLRDGAVTCGSAGAAVATVCDNMLANGYRSFLYHAETSNDERQLLISVLSGLKETLRNAVVLVPEIAHLEHIVPPLENLFGDRVCVLHSKLKRTETSGVLRRIITGASDIVVGTRSAILAPLGGVAFIAVLDEHNRSYKAEEGLRYSGRDIAVMRGFHEKSTVLLSSVCPSVESIYNARNGKYVLLPGQTGEGRRPRIKVVAAGGAGGDLHLARDVVREARQVASRKERFLFLVSRKGYSLLRCEECGFILRCATCNMPLVFHKQENVLRCHHCGTAQNAPESCSSCGGVAIKAYGAGAERVREKVRALLKEEALIIDKSRSAGSSFSDTSADLAPLVIGTSFAKGMATPFGAAAILNMDALLLQPDFRLYERAFQQVMAVAQTVSGNGTVFLQTTMSGHRILRFIKSYDFEGFYRYELSQRKEFNNPPFAKIILFTIPVPDGPQPAVLLDEVLRAAGNVSTGAVDLLGPVDLPYQSKKYHSCIQLLLKSKDRNALHNTAMSMMKALGKIKNIKMIVDVDPLKA